MQRKRTKQEVLSFKVDSGLAEQIRALSNRSEFIRNAILSALENTCPLCKGTGVLSEKQKEHWGDFRRTHNVKLCEDCREYHLVCDSEKQGE